MTIAPAISYPVMEYFYTIQGEGANTGRAAFFIRLGGCDVGCHWCDVKESWDASAHPLLTVEEITALAVKSGAPQVVITGGEPLMYDLGLLTSALHQAGLKTWIETSGAYPLSGEWDWICVSPKKFRAPLENLLEKADELKVIVYHKTDFTWGEANRLYVKKSCGLFLQPEWGREKEMLPLIIDYVKQHPEWKISLQTHKYMQIP